MACAVNLQLAIADINHAHTQAGLPVIRMGVGFNTGAVLVGNIGSEKCLKYGVVGHHVNLAARVESVSTGGQALITESTCRHCGAGVIPAPADGAFLTARTGDQDANRA